MQQGQALGSQLGRRLNGGGIGQYVLPVQFPGQRLQRLALQKRGQQQVHGVVGLLFYVIVQGAGGGTVGAAQFIRIGGKKAAALEKRAASVCQQFPRAGHDGIDENVPQIFRIHVGIPAAAEVCKMRGESCLVVSNGFLIAFGQRHFLPILPEILAVQKRCADGQKVGLQMFRHFPAAAAKASALHGVVAGQAPKGQLRAGLHGSEHRSQRADGACQREVHQHQFVVAGQAAPANDSQRFFIGTHVKALIFPFAAGQCHRRRPGTVRWAQRAVGDKEHLTIMGHGFHGHTAGGVDLAQRVIMEINDQPFHGA